jgi:hypothetical protein
MLVLGTLGIALAACSKGTSQTTAKAQAGAHVVAGNACDRKLFAPADVADLLGAPIVETKTIAGDPQTCELITAGGRSVMVTLRPGLGIATVQTWLNGRMPVSATPLPGVGDEAAWVSELSEVVARKADLLCDIQVTAGSGSKAVLQTKVGVLCNKIFTAANTG